MYRQGDILLKKTNLIPKKYEEIKKENGLIILAYGEATGHKHAINSKNALLVRYDNKIILIAFKAVELRHEEHATIKLPKGNYEVIRQREYTPKEIKYVQD